jgi:hypothetical protein
MPLANLSSTPEAASPAIIKIHHLSKRNGRNGEAALWDINLTIAMAEILVYPARSQRLINRSYWID